MDWKKKSKEEYSRALLDDELKAFLGEDLKKPFAPFVKLVNKHEELELCFRGNSIDNSRVSIYQNNHVIFSVCTTGKIVISFNHARYCKDWNKYLKTLKKDYGFNYKVKKNDKGHIDIGYITRPYRGNEPLSEEQIDRLYNDIIKQIFDRYFAVAGKKNVVDYFKDEKVDPEGKTEKIRQQEVYRKFCCTKNGYFFYDMEFAQRHKNKDEQDKDKNNNKPDMQAIRFDKKGKPEKIVFVEVKCTSAAMDGNSGLSKHLTKMKNYEKKRLDERRKEAYQILDQYSQLGLRGLSNKDKFNYIDFEKLELEILLVFTDEAIDIFENSDEFSDDREQATKIQEYSSKDIVLYRI